MDTLIACGETAPDFALPDLEGKTHRLREATGRILVLNFWSAECPWAERVDAELLALQNEMKSHIIVWWIASNANEPVEMIQRVAAERHLPVVLVDADHKAADLYGAQITPQVFVIDAQGILRYQGAVDDVNFRQRIPTRSYLRQAVEALLLGSLLDPDRTPPFGCALVRYTV